MALRSEREKLKNLNKELERKGSKDFFKILESYKGKTSNDFPDTLLFEGKMYVGDEVLNGFKEMAYSQSRKEYTTPGCNVPDEFITIKKFNRI